MATTTSYGDWNNRADRHALNLETSVTEAFGAWGDDGFDTEAIVREYRDAINAALPDSVALCGDEFIGPAYPASDEWDGYATDEDGRLDIKAIVDGIDLWAIIERHDHTS